MALFTNEVIEKIKSEILSNMTHFDSKSVEKAIRTAVDRRQDFNSEEKILLEENLTNSILKYDIIQPLLNQENISEIMINGLDSIFIEENGQIKQTEIQFSSQNHLDQLIQKIATEVGREVNINTPIMDARLKDGSRVNVILNPIALNGPIITIRKFNQLFNEPHELIHIGMFPDFVGSFLQKCIESKYNLFICGGTGSGKTTLLNCLTSYISENERIVIIEDASEIKTPHISNSISLETRTHANITTPITMSTLIKNALRMRPDRIIVGEVRGSEVIDMLQAMNTGHDGSISTGHSNSAYDMLTRLEVIASTHSDVNHLLLRRQIISAIDLLVFVSRTSNGARQISEICELKKHKDDYDLNTLYKSGDTNTRLTDRLIHKEKLIQHEI
ncbi:CpaF family protein [Fusibacter tunisiensis]|uniref:Pilus assembly protein CpaF n=1 Tax=Fusibacter tunisiensis TaxID=1008308 RepID=A0ABS2MMP8_9FIRM|nr:ATPase, T2SS/T4P/T4SS family [Fusibacter tunisiensis]MBM7560666.1 pilus assembly protein CpaF [Fusibacter tunisiensis]